MVSENCRLFALPKSVKLNRVPKKMQLTGRSWIPDELGTLTKALKSLQCNPTRTHREQPQLTTYTLRPLTIRPGLPKQLLYMLFMPQNLTEALHE